MGNLNDFCRCADAGFFEDFDGNSPIRTIEAFVQASAHTDVLLTIHGPLELAAIRQVDLFCSKCASIHLTADNIQLIPTRGDVSFPGLVLNVALCVGLLSSTVAFCTETVIN